MADAVLGRMSVLLGRGGDGGRWNGRKLTECTQWPHVQH